MQGKLIPILVSRARWPRQNPAFIAMQRGMMSRFEAQRPFKDTLNLWLFKTFGFPCGFAKAGTDYKQQQ